MVLCLSGDFRDQPASNTLPVGQSGFLILLFFNSRVSNVCISFDALDGTKLQEFAGKVNSMSVRDDDFRDENSFFSAK